MENETKPPQTPKEIAEEVYKMYINHIVNPEHLKVRVEQMINATVEAEVEKQVRLYL